VTGTPQGTGGRYLLQSRIATGGMGEVWRSEDTLLDREVAVKVLKHEYADDPTFRVRFEAEARNAAALHHPNVASVFDFGELLDDDGSGVRRPFLVMELVPGQPLSVLLRGGDPMPADTAADIVAQAAAGVAAAHRLGIVHRDVKPGNLLVTPHGTVKITDFGIARAADGAAITQTGQIIGTPHYISPEQAEGRPATEASDIYALGVVLYECLAGQRPFDRDTPIQVALAHIRDAVPALPETVPSQLRDIVDRALAKRPEDRFASAADLAAALRGGAVLGLPFPEDEEPDTDDTPTGLLPAGTATADRDRRGLAAWWPWAVAATVLLAAVLTAAGVAGRTTASQDAAATGAGTSPSPASEPAPTSEPRLRLREADYLGRPVAKVVAELERRGFAVRREPRTATAADQVEGTVAGVRPHGLVERGTEITLAVWRARPEPDPGEDDAPQPERGDDDAGTAKSGNEGGGGRGGGPGTSGKPADPPGKDKANGKAKGKKP
jgi:tRNA A-37 threonylcarbamoyl transferase component Bud32